MAMTMYYWKWPESGTGNACTTCHFRRGIGWVEKVCGTDPKIPADYPWVVSSVTRLEWIPKDGGILRMRGYWDESLYEEAQEISNNSDFLSALGDCWNSLTIGSSPEDVTFGETYEWDQMTETRDTPGGDDMAKISYHAAVAANMNFGVKASGASMLECRNALVNHFRSFECELGCIREFRDHA
ncbi:C10 family peptidase [bacterium]|nr:C10 family peptidase [bacterium]